MRPAIDAVRATGTAVAEVALCYTGDLSEPGRTALHPRLLPAAGRADRRRGRAHPGDQGHGGAAARPGRQHAGHRAARALRPAGAPAHPRHRRRPARRPARRHRGGRRRGRRRQRRRWPARPASRRCRRSSPPPTTPPARPACRSRPSATSSPTGRRCARCTRRSSPACPRRPGASTATRSPAASCPTCASRRSRSASASSSSRSRTCTPPPTGILGQHRQGHAVVSKVVGDLALHLVAVGADPEDFDDEPGQVRHPRLGDRLPAGELGDPPGGWPEPFRTKALAGRSARRKLETELTAAQDGRPRGTTAARDPRTGCCSPGPTRRVRGAPARRTATVRCSAPPSTSTGCSPGSEHQVQHRARASTLLLGLEAIGEPDERGMRTVMCTINGQLRPIHVRDRTIEPRRARPPRRPTRPSPATSPPRSAARDPGRWRTATRSRPARRSRRSRR